MPAHGQWGFDPNSGGKNIPEAVQRDVTRRILKAAEANFAGRYTRLEIRFQRQFCYIDAYTEPIVMEDWPPAGWPETKEEHLERLRNTPTHLCRLRYFGDDRWGFAFYAYSSDKYELSIYPSGDFFGTPDEAFMTSAGVYLNE